MSPRRLELRRSALATIAYLLGAMTGLTTAGLVLIATAEHQASPVAILPFLSSGTTAPLLLLALLGSALVSGVLLAALCTVRCVDAARATLSLAADKRATAVSVLSENFLQGIPNRLATAATTHKSASVVLVSIDAFDSILQTHGRSTADAALQAAAYALHASVRASDVVGRVGYDGFAVVLTVGEDEVALRASGRLYNAIRNITIPLANGGTLQLGASLGVAVRDSDEAMEATFERAHAALQQARQDETDKVKLAKARVAASV